MVGDRWIEFVTYSRSTDNRPAQQRLQENELATLLLEHDEKDCEYPCVTPDCPNKDGLAWSPGYVPLGGTRRDAQVAHFDVLGFDLDHLAPGQLEALCGRIDDLAALIYSTHRHTPEDTRVRLVLFLSHRLSASWYDAVRTAAVVKYGIPEDKKARNKSRIFFMPTSPRGAPRIAVWNPEGNRLDVDALYLERMKVGLQRQPPTPTSATQAEAGEVDIKDLRSFLKRYDPDTDYDGSRRALIARALKGEPLADKGARDDSVHRVASIVGRLLPIDTPVDAAVELLQASISSMPQYEGDGANENPEGWLQKARYSYERSHTKKIEELEQKNRVFAMARKKRLASTGSAAPTTLAAVVPAASAASAASAAPAASTTPAAPAAPAAPATPATPAASDEEWKLLLRTKMGKDKIPIVESIGLNAAVVLLHHPDWRGVLRYNTLKHEYEAIGGPLPQRHRSAERLLTAVQLWLSENVRIDLPTRELDDVVTHIAKDNPYDPIQEYLNRISWDGTPRLNTWLRTYCGAVVDKHVTDAYLARIGRMWLVAGVARALRPGVKADNVLIFEGPQSVGKSTTLQILGGDWFSDARAGLQSKDTLEITSRSWVIELPELSSMRGSETEAHKAFFSADHDHFRLAYDRRVGDYQRRCILAGSTNDDEYLRDDSGNRRYWPVYCESFDLVALRRDRDQIWAEAVEVYRAAEACPDCALPGRCVEHRWWFDRAESEQISEVVTVTRLKSEYVEPIRSWFLVKDAKDRPRQITGYEVANLVLSISNERIDSQRSAIGRAMKRLGFEKRQVGERRVWVYETPEGILAAPKVARHGRFESLTTQKVGALNAVSKDVS